MKTKKITLNLNEPSEFKDAYIAYKILHTNIPDPTIPKYEYYVWPQSWGKDPKVAKDGFFRSSVDKIPLEDIIADVERMLNTKQTPLQRAFSITKILNKIGVFSWLVSKFKSWRYGT